MRSFLNISNKNISPMLANITTENYRNPLPNIDNNILDLLILKAFRLLTEIVGDIHDGTSIINELKVDHNACKSLISHAHSLKYLIDKMDRESENEILATSLNILNAREHFERSLVLTYNSLPDIYSLDISSWESLSTREEKFRFVLEYILDTVYKNTPADGKFQANVARLIKKDKEKLPKIIRLLYSIFNNPNKHIDHYHVEKQYNQFKNKLTLSIQALNNDPAHFDLDGFKNILGSYKDIHTLDLGNRNSFISNDSLILLLPTLKEMTTIKSLNLSFTGLTDKSIKIISEWLKDNNTIEELNLAGNLLNDDALDKLWTGISCNTTLKVINISSYQISTTAIQKFCEFLKTNTTLITVLLGRHKSIFTENDLAALLSALNQNRTLQQLFLSHQEYTYLNDPRHFCRDLLIHIDSALKHNRLKTQRLNPVQKSIIEGAIKFPLNDIIQTFIAEPETAIKALLAISTGVIEEDKNIFHDVLDSIETISKIIYHPYPQNTNENYEYVGKTPGYSAFKMTNDFIQSISKDKTILLKNGRVILNQYCLHAKYADLAETDLLYAIMQQEEGLLTLTTREDIHTPPVAKYDVDMYVTEQINITISQLNDLKELTPFLKKNEKEIQDLLQKCDALTIDQFPSIGSEGLTKMLGHAIPISRLLDRVHIPMQSFLDLDETTRAECIVHSLDFVKLTEASLSWHEILALPFTTRLLFYKHAEDIRKLIEKKKITFDELKNHWYDFAEFITNKIDTLKQNKTEVTNLKSAIPKSIPIDIQVPETEPHIEPATSYSSDIPDFIAHSYLPFYWPTTSSEFIHRYFSNPLYTIAENALIREQLVRHNIHNIYRLSMLTTLLPGFLVTSNIPSDQDDNQENSTSTNDHTINFGIHRTRSSRERSYPGLFSRARERSFAFQPEEVNRPEGLWWVGNKTALALMNGNIVISNERRRSNYYIQILEPETGVCVLQLNQEGHTLPNLTLLQNGNVAGCSIDCNNIYIYNFRLGQIILTFPHHERVTDLFSIDKYLITFCKKSHNKIYIYDSNTGDLVSCIRGMFENKCMLPCGNSILLIGRDRDNTAHYQLINPVTGEKSHLNKLQNHTIGLVTLLPDGNFAIANPVENKIHVYTPHAAENRDSFLYQFDLHHITTVQSLTVSNNGNLLVGDCIGGIQAYNYHTGERLQAFKCRNMRSIASSFALKTIYERLIEPQYRLLPRMY